MAHEGTKETTRGGSKLGGWGSLLDLAEAVGVQTIRLGLATVLIWIGLMKFSTYEAEGIQGFIANSPFMSWTAGVFSVQGISSLIGVTEVIAAVLIIARPWSPKATVLGASIAVAMFMTTLSFMFTTPGVAEPSAGGFPAISVVPGQFLIKDIVLLGASVFILGEAGKNVK